MEHDWVLDTSVYYDENCSWRDLEMNHYICANCNAFGSKNLIVFEDDDPDKCENFEIKISSYFDSNLTCDEIIIKNIIE